MNNFILSTYPTLTSVPVVPNNFINASHYGLQLDVKSYDDDK